MGGQDKYFLKKGNSSAKYNFSYFRVQSILLIYYYYTPFFSYLHKLMIFHWSLCGSKSPQVPQTLLSILAYSKNAEIQTALICLLISNYSSPHSKPLATIPNVPITTGITISLMFHDFLSSMARSKYLFLFSLFLIFTEQSAGIAKSTLWLVLIFLLIITSSGLLAGIKGSVCISKSNRVLCVSFPKDKFWFVHIPFGIMVKFQTCVQFPVDHFHQPIVPKLILLLCKLATFAYYVINHFVFVTT